MKTGTDHQIFTIGHSTHTFAEFLGMLKSFDIEVLADIRHYPGSARYPQFNKDTLSVTLEQNGIEYIHIVDLGGRRKIHKDSPNTRWHKDVFRAYADYMATESFLNGIKALKAIAMKRRTAYMCSEAVWWRCHRSLVSDYLKAKGWDVQHIMGQGKSEAHPYTQAARIVGDKVFYTEA
ncbi:MAG: DUF488 domain-containing protein [Chitinophagaceae bacterium]|nr:DUF488 domain-containing protein [Chitinophagaceae bacterium]MCW5914520.1 DUF488 domain-containing protein [Chitinophagaceae bacterium]MCZ2395377.1 DUF488 domain-containing protein [Chitinophagales bacterium]